MGLCWDGACTGNLSVCPVVNFVDITSVPINIFLHLDDGGGRGGVIKV